MKSFAKFLDVPLKDVRLSDSRLRRAETIVHKTLDKIGLGWLKPKLYWSTEWFTPDGSNTIAVPFYLASYDLCSYVKNKGMYVEGEDPESFRRILMHEVGHCFEHALSIRKMRGFKDVFGCWNVPTKPFPTKDKRLLQDYLSVVGDGYGSKHPLEDFAETFAYYCLKIPSFGLTKMQRRKLRFVERQVKAAKLRSLETKPRYFYDGSAQRVSRTLRQLL